MLGRYISTVVILLIASIICVVSPCLGQKPELVLYNSRAPEIPTFTAVTNVDSDNQACLPVDIKASRVCVVSGIWLFYTAPYFRPLGEDDVVVYTRNEEDETYTCRNLPTWLDKTVGSYRFAGDPSGSTTSSLNLYGASFYRNNELKLNSSASELPFAFNSLIRLGGDRWQFYMKENYDGFSECLDEDEQYVADFTARFGVQMGDIKSIRKGCDKP